MKLQELAKTLQLKPKYLMELSYEVFGRRLNLNTDIDLKDEHAIIKFLDHKKKKQAVRGGSLIKRKKVALITEPLQTQPKEIDSLPNVAKKAENSESSVVIDTQQTSEITAEKVQKNEVVNEVNKPNTAVADSSSKNKDNLQRTANSKTSPESSDNKKKQFQNQKFSKKVNFRKLSEDTERKIYKRFRPVKNNLHKKKKKEHTFTSRKKEIVFASAMSISDFSKLIGKKRSDIVTVAKRILDIETELITSEIAELIAEELKIKIVVKDSSLATKLDTKKSGVLKTRPPIVTIMGHVDHGKTSLLDCVRNSSIADREAGNITQHIGAYFVQTPQGKITFLDTPGHEAFSSMRARGSSITDIVILVIALDDGIKPQTIEAIKHARLAKVPIIVALTKCDKPNINAKKITESLMQYELVSEEYNGDTTMVQVSAKTKEGINEILELILIQAESMQLQTTNDEFAQGVVIESRIDKQRGSITSLLVQSGTLKTGDHIFSGKFYAKIRSMSDENSNILKEVTPSQPVEVMGFSDTPPAGNPFQATNEKLAKMMAAKNFADEKNTTTELYTESLEERFAASQVKELNILLKTDTYGSLEAIEKLVGQIKHEQVVPKIIFSSIGAINRSDIHLAMTTGSLVMGFYVRPEKAAKELAQTEGIEIAIFDVIYEFIDKVKLMVSSMLEPILRQELQGKAQVLNIFNIPKIGQVAGCKVLEGKIIKDSVLKVIRSDNLVYEGKLQSLKHLKSNVEKIEQGEECGIIVQNYKNFQVDDTIECYLQTQEQSQL